MDTQSPEYPSSTSRSVASGVITLMVLAMIIIGLIWGLDAAMRFLIYAVLAEFGVLLVMWLLLGLLAILRTIALGVEDIARWIKWLGRHPGATAALLGVAALIVWQVA